MSSQPHTRQARGTQNNRSSSRLKLVRVGNDATATVSRKRLRIEVLLLWLALGHCILLVAFPVLPVIALGLWWNANTVSHNFIHRPFFRHAMLNRLFGLYLTLLLGFPQSVWRDRHLAHHADRRWGLRINLDIAIELTLVCALWLWMLLIHPAFFVAVYLPGYFIGLAFCFLQGYYEHARGATSHYGKVYNLLFLNDGYHVEHHRCSTTPWTQLPDRRVQNAASSRWPAVLRWLDAINLVTLEKLALRSKMLQRFLIITHSRAFRQLLPMVGKVNSVGIVGGGIFPRTALILQELLPEAKLVVIDADINSIRLAQTFPELNVEFIHGWYDPLRHSGFDLVIIPLSLVGDRNAFYGRSVGPAVIVHEWIWNRHHTSAIVSIFLLKRLNLLGAQASRLHDFGKVNAGS